MCRASNIFLDLIVEKYEKMLSQSRMEWNWRECGGLAGRFGKNHPLSSAHIQRHYPVDPRLLPSGYHRVALSLKAYYVIYSVLLLPCLTVYYIVSVLFLLYFWCPSMAINVSVQYNGGLLPDIILLIQRHYHRGTRLKTMKRFYICSL